MTKQKLTELQTQEFSHEEFRRIIEISRELVRRGYFTGVNFLQSDSALPQTSIIIHFLHDSKRHLEEIEPCIGVGHLIVPRFTYYMIKPEYVEKPNFREEYSNAIFFDSDFNIVSIDEAIRDPLGITVSNKELDLIVPITNASILEELLNDIKEGNQKGPEPWVDPVIIVKTETPIKVFQHFISKCFVSIGHEKEEFYCVLTDRKRATALVRYLDRLCERTKIGKLRRSDIVFYPCQINAEFADYLSRIQNQLMVVE